MGKIVPPMDAHALAQAIVEVLQQEPEFSPISIENLVSHYSPETVANAYDRIFRDLAEHYG
jgi:glycosyltransferase involved in cell wall biosynthesis